MAPSSMKHTLPFHRCLPEGHNGLGGLNLYHSKPFPKVFKTSLWFDGSIAEYRMGNTATHLKM